jgi:hypothetical protein
MVFLFNYKKDHTEIYENSYDAFKGMIKYLDEKGYLLSTVIFNELLTYNIRVDKYIIYEYNKEYVKMKYPEFFQLENVHERLKTIKNKEDFNREFRDDNVNIFLNNPKYINMLDNPDCFTCNIVEKKIKKKVFIGYVRYWNGKGDENDVKIIGIFESRGKAFRETLKYLNTNEFLLSNLIYDELFECIHIDNPTYIYTLRKDIEYIQKTYPEFFKLKDVENRLKNIKNEEEFKNEFGDEISEFFINNSKYHECLYDQEYWRYDIEEKEILV